ncbi:Uncharacterised protein [Kluyvera ascorbata]|nr:Uncharacterised protein [Kluyvera ascorbata]
MRKLTLWRNKPPVDTQKLQVSDRQLKQWQDFNIQLDRSKVSISNTFIRGLAPLTPELTKLSDAFSGAIDTVLKSPELGKWIDSLAAESKNLVTTSLRLRSNLTLMHSCLELKNSAGLYKRSLAGRLVERVLKS